MFHRLLLCLFLLFSPLFAYQLTDDPQYPWPVDCATCVPDCYPSPPLIQNIEEGVVVNLVDPTYEDGVLFTENGGVLTATGLRVQARKIVYVKRLEADPPEYSIYCEGDLLIDYEDRVLVGERFFYNFLTSSGMLINGRSAAPPWYFGGNEIFFQPDGGLIAYGGYISTSESIDKDVTVTSTRIEVNRDRILTAKNISLRLKGAPLAWFPLAKLDLKSIGESPIGFQVGYGGFMKTNISLRYRFLTLGALYGYLRLDGYLARGPGVGIETEYAPCDSPTEFYTRSYYAHDLSIDDPKRKDRYRLEGSYISCWGGIMAEGFYDFVSDGDMAAEYQRKDFDLNPAERTELYLKKSEEDWIASLFTRVRVNRFQSINQELPTFYYTWRPFEFGQTGLFCENWVKLSYLSYKFSDEIIRAEGFHGQKVHDFHSARLAVTPQIYRPFWHRYFTLTPSLRFIGIAYSNNQEGKNVGQAVGEAGLTCETMLSRSFSNFKHVLEPYAEFRYLTPPRVPLDHAFIFTIDDSYARFGVAQFGFSNSLFTQCCGCMHRPIFIDIWANAFLSGLHVNQSVPKGYLNAEWYPFRSLFFGFDTAWNFHKRRLDFYNSRMEWTISQDAALSLEYRQRSRFDWRKADFYDFLLDVTRREEALLHSPLSDRRETFLTRFFYRWSPDIWGKFILRHGWHRIHMPQYTEFEIEVTRVLFDHWHLILTYEKRETDNRFSATFRLAPSPPSRG